MCLLAQFSAHAQQYSIGEPSSVAASSWRSSTTRRSFRRSFFSTQASACFSNYRLTRRACRGRPHTKKHKRGATVPIYTTPPPGQSFRSLTKGVTPQAGHARKAFDQTPRQQLSILLPMPLHTLIPAGSSKLHNKLCPEQLPTSR